MRTDVQLLQLDPATQAALSRDPAYARAMADEDWARLAEVLEPHVSDLMQKPAGRPPAPVSNRASDNASRDTWGGYVAVDPDTRAVVGSCAFKGPPTADGAVEIAYLTFPNFEGQGYATAMARRLVERAADHPAVRRVIAHTLPEPSASTRVLEKAGLRHVGEVTDPDDGRVWRWETPAPA
ncbi:MAG: GNAT family N-acetyltransferase [Planctomycetota bacterium]